VEEGGGVEEEKGAAEDLVMRMRRVQGLDILFVEEGAAVVDEVGGGVVEEEEEGEVCESPVDGSGVEEEERSGRAGGLFAALGFAAGPKRESADLWAFAILGGEVSL